MGGSRRPVTELCCTLALDSATKEALRVAEITDLETQKAQRRPFGFESWVFGQRVEVRTRRSRGVGRLALCDEQDLSGSVGLRPSTAQLLVSACRTATNSDTQGTLPRRHVQRRLLVVLPSFRSKRLLVLCVCACVSRGPPFSPRPFSQLGVRPHFARVHIGSRRGCGRLHLREALHRELAFVRATRLAAHERAARLGRARAQPRHPRADPRPPRSHCKPNPRQVFSLADAELVGTRDATAAGDTHLSVSRGERARFEGTLYTYCFERKKARAERDAEERRRQREEEEVERRAIEARPRRFFFFFSFSFIKLVSKRDPSVPAFVRERGIFVILKSVALFSASPPRRAWCVSLSRRRLYRSSWRARGGSRPRSSSDRRRSSSSPSPSARKRLFSRRDRVASFKRFDDLRACFVSS